jgi:hypothetical protein
VDGDNGINVERADARIGVIGGLKRRQRRERRDGRVLSLTFHFGSIPVRIQIISCWLISSSSLFRSLYVTLFFLPPNDGVFRIN